MPSAAAIRYAQAMVDVMIAPGSGLQAEDVLERLRSFAQTVRAAADLRNVLASPAVRAAKKRAVAARIAEPLGIPRKALNFLYVLIDRKRILALDEILVAMEEEFDRRTGAVTAEVSSPLPLSESQRKTLETQLSLLSGRKARLKFVQDASLIGGLVAKVGSTVYDGSVKGQLAELRRRLAAQN
jgi:F-type H+-transporting ATPase subunit delta